ncbi:UNVERIFIED_CONTAM: hypothetical protein GTU68_016528 [Idotea baltica]|nr:hypothetical protein [Idotea baltica]
MRNMGKASFVHIQDSSGRVQAYVRKDDVGDDSYAEFKKYDIGDIIELKGYVFVTKTGEPSIYAESVRLLNKSLIPLPEKWHGLSDVESRYRYRYVDLIANPDVRKIFKTRAKIIASIRTFLNEKMYTEVETPILQTIAGGASAKPFQSHYNALGSDVYMRVALELPLKKLVVGGLERVYELGRAFRNEGLSKKHNPEFTMLEFYQAYATYDDLMTLTEEMLSKLIKEVKENEEVNYQGNAVNFSAPFKKISMENSIYEIGGVSKDFDLSSLEGVVACAKENKIESKDMSDWGHTLESLFDELVEHKLVNPTFITNHPASISPLARKNDNDPKITDRFELFICGMEVANAFSELNDPIDQRQRFEDQALRKSKGDDEAMSVDEDFLRALEYGLPPTGGQGIGIDRLVMLLTDSATIRDVLLFPQLKPLEAASEEGAE